MPSEMRAANPGGIRREGHSAIEGCPLRSVKLRGGFFVFFAGCRGSRAASSGRSMASCIGQSREDGSTRPLYARNCNCCLLSRTWLCSKSIGLSNPPPQPTSNPAAPPNRLITRSTNSNHPPPPRYQTLDRREIAGESAFPSAGRIQPLAIPANQLYNVY